MKTKSKKNKLSQQSQPSPKQPGHIKHLSTKAEKDVKLARVSDAMSRGDINGINNALHEQCDAYSVLQSVALAAAEPIKQYIPLTAGDVLDLAHANLISKNQVHKLLDIPAEGSCPNCGSTAPHVEASEVEHEPAYDEEQNIKESIPAAAHESEIESDQQA